MVDLPKKKVGLVACSGEELAEGTVTRLAALKVLEELRPADTVTICLPLFLAGGEGDRAFARFYPTLAIDGCEQRCAARATERYSGKPAASLVIRDLAAANGLAPIEGRRQLNEAGQQAVEFAAARLAGLVDELLEKRWDRRAGRPAEGSLEATAVPPAGESVATCACGSGIPVQILSIAGEAVTLVGLPLIFEQFRQARKAPGELLETIKIYNPIPVGAEADYQEAILQAYAAYCLAAESHPAGEAVR